MKLVKKLISQFFLLLKEFKKPKNTWNDKKSQITRYGLSGWQEGLNLFFNLYCNYFLKVSYIFKKRTVTNFTILPISIFVDLRTLVPTN